MRNKKGFTLIETVVTLSIIGVSFALVAGVVASLFNVQDTSTSQLLINKELKTADNMIKDYVSFVSLKTDDVSFSVTSASGNKVVCKYSTYSYNLQFSEGTLSITNNYDGGETYFQKTGSQQFKTIEDIKFEYTSSISLLIAEIKAESNTMRYSYVVRT